MKNWTITFAIAGIVSTTGVFAQISINAGTGVDPDNSAMLDVQSTSKGVLVSRVALTGPTDAATVPSPATSLLIYNTSSAGGLTPGYHYNSGTSGSPTWTRLMSGNTTPLSGSGTAGQVAYWSGTNSLTGSGTFTFGPTNNLTVFNPEGAGGEVRMGAAWGRPGLYSSQRLELQSGTTGILFGNGDVEYMRLTASGNLGIGSTPVEALEIFRNGSNPVQLFHASGVGSYKLGMDGNIFKIAAMDNGYGGHVGNFAANDVQVIAMNTAGNVGIGNVAASHKLHVGEATADGQPITFRSYSNTPTSWKGGGAFGFSSASVILGQLNSVAQIGGHNGALTAWADLAINAGGGNVGIGTAAPQSKLHVEAGKIYGSKTSFPNPASYTNADLVLGSNTDTRGGYTGTNGSHIFLRSSDKSTITALDESNDLGQIAYQNLRWILGENIGWGAQSIQMPVLSGAGTRMVTADATGLLGSQALPGGVLPGGTTGQTLFHNGTGWTATSNLYNNGGTINLGQFTVANTDEWPYVTWLRDLGNNWDEGLIKGSSSRGAWGRTGFGIHMEGSRHFGFFSTGWETLLDIEGGTGRLYVKGATGIGITNPGAKLTVRGGGTDPGAFDDGKALFVSGAFSDGQSFNGGIEFRHDNLTQGIGFGYNTIYQTGTNANEVLHLTARGTGNMSLNSVGGATGNVGIGTISPVGRLHVAGNHANGVMADGNDRPSIATTGVYPQMVLMSGNSGNGNHGASIMLGGYDAGASGAHKHWAIGTSGVNSTFLDFGYHAGTDLNPHAGVRNYNGSTFMTILNSGNVGIGTLAPAWKLHVVGVGTPSILANQNGTHSYGVVAGLETNSNGAGTQDGPRVGYHKAGAKTWSTGIQAGGDNGYTVWEDGYNNGWGTPRFTITNANGRATLYRYRAAGTWADSDLVLERTGAINYLPSLSLHNPGLSAPQVFGADSPERINIGNSAGGWASIAASGFTTISDVRMKKEIEPLDAAQFQNSLASIRDIQSIRYRYNNEVTNEPTPYSGEVKREQPHLGFTAQSLPTEVVVNDLTRSPSTTKDGYILGYNLNDMDGLLLAGVKALDINQQQQTSELEAMRAMMEAQKALIAEMRAEIEALKEARK